MSVRIASRAWRGARWLAPGLLGFALVACGGGGSVRSVPPATVSQTPPPPPASQPPADAQLAITNTYAAHAAGYTGKGVTIGIVDSGIMPNNPTVAGRVIQEYIDVDPTQNNTSIPDVVGHGTWVSEIAAGTSFAQFPGGIAPGADLVSARIISDNAPSDSGQPPTPISASDASFFASVNQQLIGSGVKVMNNSWGGLTWDTGSASVNQAFDAAYSPFVNQNGGLVVFAAGNGSGPQPSTFAALPAVAPDLEKGWLTVVAVNSNNPSQLASYSNQCGVAMNYCLAAPGDVIVLDKDTTASTTNPTYWSVSGTSFAAPQVSGAAALVWQAFPYFTNDLVRQTLLGTADPLGGSQPNATFGYGELDVGRAVQGPAQFNWGDVSVSFDDLTSTWSNAISGAGGLIKNGTGTLLLTGNDSYLGGTQILGGALQATHALPGNVTVGEGGALDAVPGVAGALDSSGTVVVKGGNTDVGGSYTQAASGTLSVSMGSILDVAGNAQIAGTLNVLGAEPGYVNNAHQDVLSAGGGVNGAFTQLTTSPGVFLSTTVQYTPFTVWLDTTSLSVTQAAAAMGIASPAAASAALRIQNGFDAINSQLDTGAHVTPGVLRGAAAIQHAATPAAAQATLQSLSGQLPAASAAMLFDAIDATGDALANRFGDLLAGRARSGTWVDDLGWQGNLARGGYGGATFRNSGSIVGADFPVGRDAVFGYAVAQGRGLGQLDGSWDNGQTRTNSVALYGGVARGPWYASAQLGRGWFREDMQRLLVLGGLTAPVAGGFTGQYDMASVEAGYQWRAGGMRFTPFVNLRYQHLDQGAFSEQGGYGFGLAAAARAAGRSQAGVGMRALRDWDLAGGTRLQFDGSAEWRHSLRQYGGVFDASFTGFDDWLPLSGVGLSRDYGVLQAGLSWFPARAVGVRLGFEREQGQRQESSSVMLQGTVAF